VALNMGEVHTDSRVRVEMSITQQGNQLVLNVPGSKPVTMTPTPSNPNVVRGEFKAEQNIGAEGITGHGAAVSKYVLFVREDRLYYTSQVDGSGEAQVLGNVKRETVTMSTIAILDRIE
jgi:hypothetical protein